MKRSTPLSSHHGPQLLLLLLICLTKDVQYSLLPDERIIHELLKPTRPI
jgi:hypothetical protein